MITINLENKIYSIDEDYNVKPSNKDIEILVNQFALLYSNPSQGFKTSFIAEKLKEANIDVVDVYDKEMENAPEGIVY